MISLSPVKLMVVIALVVLLLGPDKLPEVAKTLAQWWQRARQFQQRVEEEWRRNVPDLPSSRDIVRYARNPVSLLDQWSTTGGAERDEASSAPRPPGLENRPSTGPTGGPDPSLN